MSDRGYLPKGARLTGPIMKRVLFVGVACVVVAGCVSERAEPERVVTTAVNTAIEDCRARTFKTTVEKAQCRIEAEAPLKSIASAPDLLAVRWAKRMALAERVDRKEITEAQAQLEYAETVSQHTSEVERRNLNRRAEAAQEETASAASSAAFRASIELARDF